MSYSKHTREPKVRSLAEKKTNARDDSVSYRSQSIYDEDASDSDSASSENSASDDDDDASYESNSDEGSEESSDEIIDESKSIVEANKSEQERSGAASNLNSIDTNKSASFGVVKPRRARAKRNVIESDDDADDANEEENENVAPQNSQPDASKLNSVSVNQSDQSKQVETTTFGTKRESCLPVPDTIVIGDSPSVIFDSFSVHESGKPSHAGDAEKTPRVSTAGRTSSTSFSTRLTTGNDTNQKSPIEKENDNLYDSAEIVYDDLCAGATSSPFVQAPASNLPAPAPAPVSNSSVEPVIEKQKLDLQAAIARVKANAGGKVQPHTELLNVRALPANLARELIQDRIGSTRYDGRLHAAERREIVQFTDDAVERLHSQLNSVPRDDVSEIRSPRALSVELLPHQRIALRWLLWREAQFPSGGILADEMGLGKTLSVLALAAETRQLEREDETARKRRVDNYARLKKLGGNLITSDATLIVCPASLISHWKEEAQSKLLEGNNVYVFRDADRQIDARSLARYNYVVTNYEQVRSELCTPEMREQPALADAPVQDSGSGSDSSEFDESADSRSLMLQRGKAGRAKGNQKRGKNDSVLMRIIWRRIVLDEAHTIKNHRSLNSMTVCRLRGISRWALSGTPIHNSLKDVYALLRFLRCHPFDDFRVWQRTIETSGRGKQAAAAGEARLNLLVSTLLLRRTKESANLLLPVKKIETIELRLDGVEARLYEQLFAVAKTVFIDYLKERGDMDALSAQRQLKSEARDLARAMQEQAAQLGFSISEIIDINFGDIRACMLTLLIRLRQFCVHPALMKKLLRPEEIEADANDVAGLFGKMSLADKKLLQRKQDDEEDEAKPKPNPKSDEVKELRIEARGMFADEFISSKLRAVLDYIRFVIDKQPEGTPEDAEAERDADADAEEAAVSKKRVLPDKVVIVSEWTSMLDIIKTHLVQQQIRFTEISGHVDVSERQEIVHRFNRKRSGPRVMLLSLKAGGVGLNLIGANHLCFVDVHWNPALEQQAADRIHRFGQAKNVFIKKFVCLDTLEDRIVRLQAQKMSLAHSVLTGGKSNRNLTIEDMKTLFDLKSEKKTGRTAANVYPSQKP